MKIGLDFDGVIHNSAKLKSRVCEDLYGKQLPLENCDATKLNGVISLEHYRELQETVASSEKYAKFMEAAGMSELIRNTFEHYSLGPTGIVIVIILIWLALGMILDSISIILITVPIFAPLTEGFFDPIAFAIFGILVIEAGLLTPPFGLLVYTVKGSIDDKQATLAEIFKGSVPYWILMLVVMLMIWRWPEIATWLPTMMLK